MTSPAIRTDGLSRQFGAVCALDGLSLEIPRGIIFGFLGPNGSGKTTTIRLLLGLLEATSGSAEVLGYDTRTDATAIRERSGALLEHCGLYERLNAADNLDLYGRFWQISRDHRRARIRELLSHLDLWERRDEMVAGWSRGMKQKLAIARALLHRPELVFLDEPTAGLDPIAAVTLRDDLSRLTAREGVTVFLTTHNLAEAERLCALVGVVHNGKLKVVAPPAQLNAMSETPRVEIIGAGLTEAMMEMLRAHRGVVSARADGRCLIIDLKHAADVSSVVAALVSLGYHLETVRNSAGSLEDVFHSLVEAQR
ncbi:MAG: ABC transporter ATP-binding protein [Acidobacteria bacterium]|nr:ABC transporter ATP-binding protein [Acidobacteriota bacterium]